MIAEREVYSMKNFIVTVYYFSLIKAGGVDVQLDQSRCHLGFML